MQKKQCPNGHVYDPSIYGNSCPLCPPGTQPPAGAYDNSPKTHLAGAPSGNPIGGSPAGVPPMGGPKPAGGGTAMGGPIGPQPGADLKTHLAGSGPIGGPRPVSPQPQGPDASGPTQVRSEAATPRGGGRTVIRRNHGGMPSANPERRLVGFLVTYNRNPAGRAFNIYEGRNYVGRDSNCDIALPDDGQMSGKHFSILYRTADNKFKFRDEQSTNGTFVNKNLLDDGELQSYDIIRAGSTIFIFIPIPIIQ